MASRWRKDAFQVVDQAVGREQRLDAGLAQSGDRLMLYREDDRVERPLRQLVGEIDAVFVFGEIDIRHRIVGHHLNDEIAQRADEIDHFGIARIGHVLLEGEAHHQHPGAIDALLALEHGLDHVVGDVRPPCRH